MNILRLIVRACVVLLSEGGSRFFSRLAGFEQNRISRLADLPPGLLEGSALFARALLKGSGEGFFALAFLALFLLLFLVLQ